MCGTTKTSIYYGQIFVRSMREPRERDERYHLVMKKLNSFEMSPSEGANEIYSHLNVLVEEVNGLGLTQMQPSDVVRKILSVLPIDKYGHIVMVLHQSDLSPLRQLKY